MSERSGSCDRSDDVSPRFDLLSKALGEVVWDWDFGTGLIEARGATQAFGIDRDLVVKAYAWFEERVHPTDRQGVNEKLRAAIAGRGDRWCAEYRFRHEDGSYRWFWDRGLIVRGIDGAASRMIGCMTDVTSRKAAIQQLRDSERRLQALVTATSSFICRFDPAGQILAGEEDWIAFTGAGYKGCSNEETLSLLHPDDRDAYVKTKTAAWEIGAEYSAEVRLLHVDGTYRWLAITGVPVRDEGRIVEWVLLFVDVHEAREAERRQDSLTAELAERVKELRSLHAATIACNQDDLPAEAILKNIVFLLPSALLRPHFGLCTIEWLGRRFASDDDLLPGALVREKLFCRGTDVGFIELGYGSGRRLDLLPEERQLLRTVASLISQMLSRRADREDIEAQRQQNWIMAHHDTLTGLPNRRLFQQKLEEAVSATLDQSCKAALILIDLDHFKDVNDLLGHDAGDVLLTSVARRVSAAVGERGLVARIGGDEFAVLLPNLVDVSECAYIARGIVSALHPAIPIEGQPVSARATLGTAVAPVDGSTAAELLKAADIALYTGKARGRDDLVAFSSSMRIALEERVRVCASVRASLSDDHFVPYYQPQVCLESGRVFGFEALIRWLHPAEGLKGPATMLPAFEDAELALKLGDRLLTHVIRDLSAWRAGGFQPGHVSLNLCSAEFKRPNLAEHIVSRVSAAGIPMDCIAVEVTETVLLGREADAVARTLEQLHQAGIKIALDDFGTGYASLTHLKQFPVDIIKIDQSFVRSMPTDPECHAIVSTITDLGHRLGKTVVAEGVEAEEHASMLSQAGCKLAQGFLFAKPMPASRVPYLLTGAERQHWMVEANLRKKVKAA